MAHYAFLDENNIVVKVIVGVDENVTQTDTDGKKIGGSSESWESFYQSQPIFSGLICKRTSYNNSIRKNYAGIGYTYDPIKDAFIPPKPEGEGYILNEDTCQWDSISPYPLDGKKYIWNSEISDWEEIVE